MSTGFEVDVARLRERRNRRVQDLVDFREVSSFRSRDSEGSLLVESPCYRIRLWFLMNEVAAAQRLPEWSDVSDAELRSRIRQLSVELIVRHRDCSAR